MSKDKFELFVTSLIIIVLVSCFFAIGLVMGKEIIRQEAIDKGYAEYIFIDNRGNTEFRWIEAPQVK